MLVFKRYLQGVIVTGLSVLILSGCATQRPPVEGSESPHSQLEQQLAQQAIQLQPPAQPELKRKIALGRITNETIHGRSLLRDPEGDALGKQITDMLSQQLTESGFYMVFERPDLGRLEQEAALTSNELEIVGVDNLIVGSLTEFGRRTEGERGFLSETRRQIAQARVDLRVLDVRTGQVVQAVSGSGEASVEAGSIAGFGSRAGYDSTLNDMAVSNALNDAINKLSSTLFARPWQADILMVDGNQIYTSGGASQGIQPGMEFDVKTKGQRVRSEQTGFMVNLPGETVARVRVTGMFGSTPTDEGSVVEVIQGSIEGHEVNSLIIVAPEDQA